MDSSEDSFPLHGIGSSLKDLHGRPTIRWHPSGMCVQVSIALPYWGSEKITRHATAVGASMYDKRNLNALRKVDREDLSCLVAQVSTRSFVTNHFMGFAYKRLLKDYSQLEDLVADKDMEIARLKEKKMVRYYLMFLRLPFLKSCGLTVIPFAANA
ncbi:hypothetical protein KSP40_PGU003970 [Platanthera guangdongensis]|uniref:Uncharacterized protein n=1 Tax=Platanthera guangdongensis TaxID=2320717 RepID=A0ABR2LVL2_9ASPA